MLCKIDVRAMTMRSETFYYYVAACECVCVLFLSSECVQRVEDEPEWAEHTHAYTNRNLHRKCAHSINDKQHAQRSIYLRLHLHANVFCLVFFAQ